MKRIILALCFILPLAALANEFEDTPESRLSYVKLDMAPSQGHLHQVEGNRKYVMVADPHRAHAGEQAHYKRIAIAQMAARTAGEGADAFDIVTGYIELDCQERGKGRILASARYKAGAPQPFASSVKTTEWGRFPGEEALWRLACERIPRATELPTGATLNEILDFFRKEVAELEEYDEGGYEN